MAVQTLEKSGDTYNDFELIRVIDLPEIQCQLRELEHLPTGAQVMHIANEDEENVFCLSFQTAPENSNGVAHILEHTVLCGSEKFPVKDPFFAMTRRSLNTFMNAFTGSDFTCYPAASQVPKDFYNLLEVYLDAVFKPKLHELSFKQEGHRLEFTNPTDPTSPIKFKGIVFNEMKGAMSSPDSRLSEAMDEALFPDLTYGHNSGGNPKNIPELTYRQLLDFHRKHYHPSRCIFFFYGNLPLEGHLDFIEKNTLKGVEKVDALPLFPKQPRFENKVKNVVGYPYASEEDPANKSLIAFAWLTCDLLDQDTLLALNVISTVLLSTDAAPLKKALLKSGMCKQVSAYIVDDFSEIPVVITLKGCREEDSERLGQVITETLKEIVEKGVPGDLVENAIHQIEFHRSEITGDSYPFGLTLFLRSGLLKQHGGKPENGLLVHSLCDSLRKSYTEDPNYFINLIKKYFLDNTHSVCTVAKPDRDLVTAEMNEEIEALNKLRNEFNEAKEKEIVELSKKLTEFQDEQAHADIDVLPKVTLDDVPKKSKEYPLKKEKAGNLDVFHHECFTNEIVYASLVFPLPAIEENELSLLKLFTLLMPQMGCGGRSYIDNLNFIQANTGGVGATETINIQVHDFNEFHPYFFLQGKALHHKADKLFTLMHEMVTSTDFTDLTRIKEVIVKHFSSLQNSLNRNALRYAINLAASGLSMASRIGHAWGGLEYYYFIKNIVDNFDDSLEGIAKQLEELRDRVLCLENPHLVITSDAKMYNKLKSEEFYGLQNITTQPFNPWKNDYAISEIPMQGRVISSPVAFTSKIFKSLPYTHPDTPALNVAGNLFDNLTLHTRIREQGGAYGGGAMNNALSGNFCFYSYRDPNISSTFDAFEEAIQRILKGDFKESDLEEGKLEIIQGLDSPLSPGSRGFVAYSWMREGKSLQVRQAFRDNLLAVTRDDVIEVVKKHILPKHEEGNVVVFAGKELLEKENVILISRGKKPLKIEEV